MLDIREGRPLRGFFVTLLLMLGGVCSWCLLCTWKSFALEAEARAYHKHEGAISQGRVDAYLARKYGKQVIWKTPFGGITYPDIRKYSLRKGGDLVGKVSKDVTVDQAALLTSLCKRHALFDRALLAAKQDEGGDLIARFFAYLDRRNERAVTYLRGSALSARSSNKEVERFVRRQAQEMLHACVPTLQRRLDPDHDGRWSVTEVDQGGGRYGLRVESLGKSSGEDVRTQVENQGKIDFYAPCTARDHLLYVNKINEALVQRWGNDAACIRHDNYGFYATLSSRDKIDRVAGRSLLGREVRLLFGRREQHKYRVHFLRYREQYNREGFLVDQAAAERADIGSRITVTLTEQSGEKLKDFTTELLSEAQETTPQLAIVVDDTVLTAPALRTPLGSRFSITGGEKGMDRTYCRRTASVLNSGALPAKLVITNEEEISASLGQAAQQKGFRAIWLALLMVLLFMFLYYALAGLVAIAALFANMVISLGVMALLGMEFSLDSIASLALTAGALVDANVIINKQIEEGLLQGMSVRSAIVYGYRKSFRVIFDANVTTFGAALILYLFAGGMVKAFALTLMIGLVTSFLTTVLLTQLLLEKLTDWLGPHRVSFAFPSVRKLFKDRSMDFFGQRKRAYLASAFFLFGGGALVAYQGLDYGIEFTGGRVCTVAFEAPVPTEAIQEAVDKGFQTHGLAGNTVVNKLGQGQSHTYRITTNHGLKNQHIDIDGVIQQGIAQHLGVDFMPGGGQPNQGEFTLQSSFAVSATSADTLKKGSFWAMVLALLFMLIYIFWTFNNFKMAASALLALLHDMFALVICLGLAKWLGFPYCADLRFLMAVLFVFGYSVNDTLFFFKMMERVMQANTTQEIQRAINRSINVAKGRTVVTSVTTFLPVAVLYLFGGVVLESLALFLACGVVLGTYSSFVAPLLVYEISRVHDAIKRRRKMQR